MAKILVTKYRETFQFENLNTVFFLGFRESPISNSGGPTAQQINHQVSISLASMMDPRRYGVGVDPMLFYEKVGKCESEPPSYANLPPKLRLGGSGSSLAKNSNESLGSHHNGRQLSNNNVSNSGQESGSSNSNDGNANTTCNGKSIDEQLKELNTQLLSKVKWIKIDEFLVCLKNVICRLFAH